MAGALRAAAAGQRRRSSSRRPRSRPRPRCAARAGSASPAICPTTSRRRSCSGCSSLAHACRGRDPRARNSRPAIVDATLMVQREVADRIEAVPGTGDYGVAVDLRAAARRRPPRADAAARGLPAAAEGPLGGRPARRSGRRRCRSATRARSTRWSGRCSRSGARRWRTRWRRSPTARAARGRRPAQPPASTRRRRPETLQLAELARLADRLVPA